MDHTFSLGRPECYHGLRPPTSVYRTARSIIGRVAGSNTTHRNRATRQHPAELTPGRSTPQAFPLSSSMALAFGVFSSRVAPALTASALRHDRIARRFSALNFDSFEEARRRLVGQSFNFGHTWREVVFRFRPWSPGVDHPDANRTQ
jgi:hypothetical protein